MAYKKGFGRDFGEAKSSQIHSNPSFKVAFVVFCWWKLLVIMLNPNLWCLNPKFYGTSTKSQAKPWNHTVKHVFVTVSWIGKPQKLLISTDPSGSSILLCACFTSSSKALEGSKPWSVLAMLWPWLGINSGENDGYIPAEQVTWCMGRF